MYILYLFDSWWFFSFVYFIGYSIVYGIIGWCIKELVGVVEISIFFVVIEIEGFSCF